jgi:GT2 family glycosyltransferase
MSINFSIIIPNLNGQKYLEDCLPPLLKSIDAIKDRSKYEIILVDNGSTDKSIEVFNKILNKENHQVIKNSTNHGFSPAINQGIKASAYDWLVLLNNDLIIDRDWFVKIYKQIEATSDKYAVFCGTVLTKDGQRFESTGLKFDYRGKCQNVNNGKAYNKKDLPTTPSEIWGSSAALAVYNKEVLQKVGGFDSDFFAYEEDVDVSLRLHLLGYKTFYIPNAISYHLGGGTSSRMNNFRFIMDAKNWFYIIIKDYPLDILLNNFYKIFIERLRNLSGLSKATIKIFKIKSIYYLPLAFCKSYGEVLFNLPKMLRKRRHFQNLLKSTHG